MKTVVRALRWLGFGIGGLAAVIVLVVAAGMVWWPAQADKVSDVPPVSLAGLRPDAAHGE